MGKPIMPLHAKNDIKHSLLDDIYGSADLGKVMPKYKMPEREHDPRHAFAVVRDELMLDGNSRQNLATFCQTWLDPEVHELIELSIDKNMIDKDEHRQSAEIEARCVHILADLWNAPMAAIPRAAFRPCAGRSRTASTPTATRSMTSPTGCAAAAGRCRPTRCRATARTW